MRVDIANRVLELVEGDITEMETDAIVNAANAQLILGGGVAGAIRKKGGPAIQQECNKIGGTFVGGAVITGGGNLKAKYVIHAVGPRMGEGNEDESRPSRRGVDEKLKNATLNSLKLADEKKLKSISFPAISTGVFGFPIQRCAEIMLRTTIDYLTRLGARHGEACRSRVDASRSPKSSPAVCLAGQTGLQKVVFCLFGRDSYQVFENQLKKETSK